MRRPNWPQSLLPGLLARAALWWVAAHVAFRIASRGVWRLEWLASAALVGVVAFLTWHATRRAEEDLWLANLGTDPRLAAVVGGAVALAGEVMLRVTA
ncbi:MAG TPA: hypothetical protein VGI83_02250 [Gemmatimonadales bacterium]